VRVVELGARGLDLICEMEGAERVIVIDAVRAGGKPGSICRFAPEEARSVNSRTSSLHGIDLLDVLELAAVMKIRPQVVIVGVEPEEVTPGQSLSETVRSCVPQVVEVVKPERRTLPSAHRSRSRPGGRVAWKEGGQLLTVSP